MGYYEKYPSILKMKKVLLKIKNEKVFLYIIKYFEMYDILLSIYEATYNVP